MTTRIVKRRLVIQGDLFDALKDRQGKNSPDRKGEAQAEESENLEVEQQEAKTPMDDDEDDEIPEEPKSVDVSYVDENLIKLGRERVRFENGLWEALEAEGYVKGEILEFARSNESMYSNHLGLFNHPTMDAWATMQSMGNGKFDALFLMVVAHYLTSEKSARLWLMEDVPDYRHPHHRVMPPDEAIDPETFYAEDGWHDIIVAHVPGDTEKYQWTTEINQLSTSRVQGVKEKRTSSSTCDDRILARALRDRGLKKKGIAGDGNCLLNAVRHQLMTRLMRDNVPSHEAMREAVWHEMAIENPERYVCRIESDEYVKYLDEIKQPGTWCDEPEIVAIANIYNLKILVIADDGIPRNSDPYRPEIINNETAEIIICYVTHNHFESTEPLETQ